jgi:hypothetical protein
VQALLPDLQGRVASATMTAAAAARRLLEAFDDARGAPDRPGPAQ